MNRFRKSDSKTHSSAHHRQQQPRLSALNLKLLRRCRIVLVKDLDAVELLRQLPDDDALGAEVRSTVAGLADRARQAAAILDALEMAGDDTFTAFLGVLRDQHRQLHSVLEETRHSLKEEDEDGEVRERAAVAGENVRRLLRRYDGRTSRRGDDATSAGERAASTGSMDGGELSDDPSSSTEYIACFTVPTRGRRLQPEQWINHATIDSVTDVPTPSSTPPYETLLTTRDMIFRRVDVSALRQLSGLLRLPPLTVASAYVVDPDYVPDLPSSPTGTVNDRGGTLVPATTNEPVKLTKTRLKKPEMAEPRKATVEMSRKGSKDSQDGRSPPPPLPPKPADLPQIGGFFTGLGHGSRPPPDLAPPPSRPPPPPVCSPRPASCGTATPPLPIRHRSSTSRPPAAEPATPGPSEGTMTASNDSLNSAFTDSSAADGDEKSQRNVPQDFEVDQPPPDDSSTAAVEEPLPENNSNFTGGPTDDDEDPTSPTDDLQTPSTETAVENDDAVGKESTSTKNPSTDATVNDDQVLHTSGNCDVQSLSTSTSLNNVDDVTGPDNDDGDKTDSVTTPDNADDDPGPVAEVRSTVDEASPCQNVDRPTAREAIDEVDIGYDAELGKENEAWTGLSQREDSGIVSVEVQPAGSSGDQPVSSGSSDGEVVTLHQAQVVVHVSADATPTEGEAGQGGRTSRRRTSVDSTDRSAAAVARDSGVDSVLSLPHQGYALDDSDSVPGLDELGLADIHIPAAGDDDLEGIVDDDDDDRLSVGYSHYEDIEVLDSMPSSRRPTLPPTDDLYLDPRRPDPGGRTSASLGRQPTYRSDRYGYGQAERRRQLIATLEASGRMLMDRGTVLVVDVQDPCPPTPATDGEADPVACYRGTRLGYNSCGMAFYVSADALKSYGDPTDEPWFYPASLTPLQATLFLRAENRRGCFVVYRAASNSASGTAAYTLSVCLGHSDVVHYSIVRNPRGDLSVAGHDHSFLSLSDLVTYFRRNRGGLASRLLRPMRDARRSPTAGVDFPARYEVSRADVVITSRAAVDRPGRLGTGFLGQYRGHAVVVRVMRPSPDLLHRRDVEDEVDEEFLSQVTAMIGLRHDNIGRLIGVSCRERPFYLLTEHYDRGSLRDCLRDGAIPSDNVEALFDVCIQAVAALAYLEAQRYVLHRAVASKNFVVAGEDRLIKLCGFERARRVSDDDYLAAGSEEVIVRWAAPEVLLESRYSSKSDVWALGVVVWEVFSQAALPFSSLTTAEEVAMFVVGGGRLDRPPGCASDLAGLMRSCWRRRPADRPTFAALHDKMKGKSSIYYVTPMRGPRTVRPAGKSTSAPPPLPPPLDRVRHPSVPEDCRLGVVQLPSAASDRPKPKRPGSASSRGDRLPAMGPAVSPGSPGWDAASVVSSSSTAVQDPSAYELEDFKRTSIRKSFHDLIHKRKKKTKPT